MDVLFILSPVLWMHSSFPTPPILGKVTLHHRHSKEFNIGILLRFLICISQNKDVKHLFMCLLAIQIASGEIPFKYSARFSISQFVLLLLLLLLSNFKCLFLLDSSSSLDIWFTNISRSIWLVHSFNGTFFFFNHFSLLSFFSFFNLFTS